MVGPLSNQIARLVFVPQRQEPSNKDTTQVEKILTDLQAGKIDRTLFTVNANSYFSETALQDCKASLSPLGKLKSVAAESESLRGGMTFRSYRVQFAKKTLLVTIYLLPDGKYEQFLVEDQV
jgi:D-alanyl-D-alanine carboxypeptidase